MKPINLFNASQSPYHGTEQVYGGNGNKAIYLWSSETREDRVIRDSIKYIDLSYLTKRGIFFSIEILEEWNL